MFTAYLSTYLLIAGKLGENDSRRGTRGQLVGGTVEVQVVNVFETKAESTNLHASKGRSIRRSVISLMNGRTCPDTSNFISKQACLQLLFVGDVVRFHHL